MGVYWGLNEKISMRLFSLNSSVSCGFVFVCSKSVSVRFLTKSNNSLSFQRFQNPPFVMFSINFLLFCESLLL